MIKLKQIILILLLLVLIIGCTNQNEELPKVNLEQETEVINNTPPVEMDIIEEPEVQEHQTTKKLEVYNPETGKTEIVDGQTTNSMGGTITSKGDDLLKAACKDSINDYPEWTKPSTDIIIWEDPDKSFYFRNSPEDMSARLSSPVQTSEILADMNFVGLNEISYVKTTNNKWQIGLFKLHWPDAPDYSTIYEKTESVSSIDISPLNKKEFVVFYVKGNNAFLEYLDTSNSKEEILFETSVSNSNRKVALSPKGTYAYLLYSKTLRLFDISKKSKIVDINYVSSVVWVGNSHLLYSNSEGTYIYDVVSKNSDKITGINTAEVITFNPKSEGVIAYTSNSETKVVNCQNRIISLGSYGKGKIETLTSEKTAILTKEDLSNSGYWRFEGDWYVKLSDKFSVLATVWSNY